jgi:hypothetical protein
MRRDGNQPSVAMGSVGNQQHPQRIIYGSENRAGWSRWLAVLVPDAAPEATFTVAGPAGLSALRMAI